MVEAVRPIPMESVTLIRSFTCISLALSKSFTLPSISFAMCLSSTTAQNLSRDCFLKIPVVSAIKSSSSLSICTVT